jgi:hypothetical protein
MYNLLMFKLDNLLRKRIRKDPPIPMTKISLNQKLPMKNQLLKQLQNQSQLLRLLQNQLYKLPLSILPKLVGQKLELNKLPKPQLNHYILHSLLETSNKLTLSQTTNHLQRKTLLKVDMLPSFSSLLLNKNHCLLFMRTSAILILYILTLKASDYSLKTLVLEWEK